MAITARSRDRRAASGPASDSGSSRRSLFVVACIVSLGVLVRFATLGEQSFWFDEATTYGIVSHGFGHVLSSVPKSESTPPLYYVLVWLWSRAFGVHEVGLRSFSALCGTLTIPVVWCIGRRLATDRVGLIAALLTAVNPLLFWYSQEARSYSLMLLLSALSLLSLLWALEAPSPRRLLVWSFVSAVALWAHYFAAFAIAPEAVWLAYSLRRSGLIAPARIAAALTPIVVTVGALVPLAVHQNDGRAAYIANDSGSLAFRAAQLVKQDIVAYDEPLKLLISIAAVLLVSVALVILTARGSRRERAAALLPLTIGGGAVLLSLLVAAIGTDYVNTRNLLESWPALVVVAAMGFGAARAGRLGAAALAGLVAVSLASIAGVMRDARFQRLDWRGAARAIGHATVPRAIVADHLAQASFSPYMSGLANFPASGGVREVDVVAFISRPAGSHTSMFPPRPKTTPALPGFAVVESRETDSYTLLRYRASVPTVARRATLLGLGLVPGGSYTVLLQQHS